MLKDKIYLEPKNMNGKIKILVQFNAEKVLKLSKIKKQKMYK